MEYELLENETLLDLVEYANGFSETVDLDKKIRLTNPFKGNLNVTDISINELKDIIPINKSALFIDFYLYKTVSIEGAVKYPGSYELNIGDKLTDLIEAAGGYRDEAYPFGGILKSKSALSLIHISEPTRPY